MAFGLDKFTRLFSRPSKNMSDVAFTEMRCECEAIEKITRPKSTSNPKETLSQESPQNPQEPVIFFAGPRDVLKALTSSPSETPPVEHIPSVNPHARPAVVSTAGRALLDSRQAVIGRDFETGGFVTVGEEERCGGLYVLGQPRTGKSELLVSLALTDIENGRGILFVDPHTDAINKLLARIPDRRRDDVILLDPTQTAHSFGLNILHCKDPQDPMAIDETWGRVRDIFVKVWEQERGQLGFWLDKILRNSVYLLVGNPGFTLAELPLLLREDTTFRNYLIENMKIKESVRDFWYYEFDRLTRRDKTEQVGPSLNRLSVFRDIEIVRHVVGQEKSTLDFSEILNTQKLVLLRLASNLTSDVKNLIGTMLLSEVLYAAFEREKLRVCRILAYTVTSFRSLQHQILLSFLPRPVNSS